MAVVDGTPAEWQIPLNDFQRLMLYWNEQLPFHVVDVVEVLGGVDANRLQTAANDELQAAGIASPHVDMSRGICVFRPSPCSFKVEVVTPTPELPLLRSLEQQVTQELRRPFQLNVDPLIRLWIMPHGSASYVGMTWQHWLGDGLTAGDLLRRILARACGWNVAPETTLNDWQPVDDRAAFAPWFTWRRKLKHAWETLRTVSTSSQVALLQRPHGELPQPNVYFLELPTDALTRLRRVGRPLDATVNDVLVAATARALAAALPRSARHWWQRNLRIGNIVDLRPTGGPALQGKAGMYLGLYNVDCPPEPPAGWNELIDHVRRRSNRSKGERTYLASLGGFRFSRKIWPWVPASWRRTVYTNILRLTGVLTNLRYPDTWYAGDAAQQVGACWRAVPMGFMYPLVLAITTLGDRLTITMSCDATGPIADQADKIMSIIQEAIAEW